MSNNLSGARRISLKTQLSSNSAQQNQLPTQNSKENSMVQISKQLSINNNTNMEGVITESDSCLHMMSNNQFVINSRHAAFMFEENVSNPSSQNTINVNQLNAISYHLKGEGSSVNFYNNNSQSLNISTFNSQSQLGYQQNNGYVNAFKDKRLTPTMRRQNDGNQFNYETNYFNSQKWKNTNQKKGGETDDRGGGINESEPYSMRNTVQEYQSVDMNRHCVDLQQMQLQRLPSLVQDMKNTLQVINLSYNNFVIFPQELCQFLHLKVMKLDFNYLNEIPEQIAFLKYLEELSVSHNCLKELPGTLQNMSNLRILNVGQNNITQIGQEVTNIKRLEVLYIYNNEFTVLPTKIRNLIHLKELGLDWFRYNKPPIDTLLTRPAQNSIFSKLFDLCGQHAINQKSIITFKEFVKHFSLVDSAVDFTKTDARGRTIAFLATESEELGVLKALLDENKDMINHCDKEGQTLLTQALIDNKVRSIQFLLDNGADPKKGGGHLGSSLHMATSKLNQELVLKFLQMGVNPNAVDFEGSTPLHIAFSIFQKDQLAAKVISEQLLSSGADPNLLNKDLWTPLHIAVRKNQKDAIRYALQYNEKLRQKLNVHSPRNSFNQYSNYSGLNNEDEQTYDQQTRDSQKRQPSYNLKNDFVDENNNSHEHLGLIHLEQSTTPYKQNMQDKSNASTPKVGSEDLILHNRSQLNQDAATTFSKKSSHFLNRQEEDLSDENEDRSPGQTHRTAHFNNQQSQKISKNCKKCFKFDRRGGANKWTVMHLAANQGNINMLEILSDANACSYAMTKFNQTPRKVALQSLILFKILRKYENRWMLKNVLGEECQSESSARDNVVERNIQNLRGFIAETMKRKEHFLHEQLDLFDDKEFGYSIKENMQNNKVQNPRNKENGNESDEDEVLDPELSFEKTGNSFKFNGLLAQQSTQQMLVGGSESLSQLSSLIIPPNSGTLKPQQFGSVLRQNSKGSAQKYKDDLGNKKVNKFEDDDDDEEDLMNDIDECDEDNDMDDFDEIPSNAKNRNTAIHGNGRNMIKTTSNNEERSCLFMKNLSNMNMLPPTNNIASQSVLINYSDIKGGNQVMMNTSKQTEFDEQKKQRDLQEKTLTTHFFTDIQSLEQEKFTQELEKLKNHFFYQNTIFQESMNVLFLLQIIHIRMSYKNMKFISEKGTLPRNIHIMNEFLHSKMTLQSIEEQKQLLPAYFISFLHELLGRIKPLPTIDLDTGTAYVSFNKLAAANRQNAQLNQLILRTRDALCSLNCFDFLTDYMQKCQQIYSQSNQQSQNATKDHIIAFSTCDYTNSTFLDFENMQSMHYIQNIKPLFANNSNNTNIERQSNNYSYNIVGSPNFYYQQKQNISSHTRKSQSQSYGDPQRLAQQGNAPIKHSKMSGQNQDMISHKNYFQNQGQTQLQLNNNIKYSHGESRTSASTTPKNIQSQNVSTLITSVTPSTQAHIKNSKSFTIETQKNNKSVLTDTSNAAQHSKRSPVPSPSHSQFNSNYMHFSKQYDEQNASSLDMSNPQFIQLSQRMEEPKIPGELKKIDMNTFGVNSNTGSTNMSQIQGQSSVTPIQKNYNSTQLQTAQALSNQQPPGPKNLKNNNTTFASRLSNLDDPSMFSQENKKNAYKQSQQKSNDLQTISTATIHSQTQTKAGTSNAAASINNLQDVCSIKVGNKHNYQSITPIQSNKYQLNQSYQLDQNNQNKVYESNNRSYQQVQSTKSQTNPQISYASKQLSYIIQPDVPQKSQHQYYDSTKQQYASNYTSKQVKTDSTPQHSSNNALNQFNDIPQNFSEQYRKNQRLYITKTGEENISDEDLSDESSNKRTQDASKKYSDYKLQFSPFNQKI